MAIPTKVPVQSN